jgi:imidazolonepropionase-like amidohydrolase
MPEVCKSQNTDGSRSSREKIIQSGNLADTSKVISQFMPTPVRFLRHSLIVPITAAVLLAPLTSLKAGPHELVIQGGSVIDTRTGKALENQIVVIKGDRIARVAPAKEVAVPADARVIDARGQWIVPGLIDMHVHRAGQPDLVPFALYVANGVTSIRDMGGNLTLLRLARNQVESGKRLGPRLFFLGPILDGDPPLAPPIAVIVDTPARAISTVNFLVDQGVDAIKIYNGISAPILEVIVRTARLRNVRVVGHVPRALTVSRAVEIGMQGLEHAIIRAADLEAWGVLTREDTDRINASKSVTVREAMVWRHIDLKSPDIAKLIAQLAAAKTVLDPTLNADEYDSLFLYPAQASHPNNRFLRQSVVDEALGPEHQIFKVPRELEADARSGVEKRRAFVGMCHRAGVKIVAGTDGPGIGHLAPGFGLHRELELLVMAGLTPSDALRAATFEAAAALGHEKDLGAIGEGKLADLVIVRADPRLSIANMAQIEAVVLRGQFLDRTKLNTMLDEVAAEAQKEK